MFSNSEMGTLYSTGARNLTQGLHRTEAQLHVPMEWEALGQCCPERLSYFL